MSPRDVFELLLLAAIWGASFLFQRAAAPELPPAALVEIRVVVAALFLTGWLAARGALGQLRGHMKKLALLGAINSALPFTLFAFATATLPAGLTSVLNATTPMFAVLIGFLWLRERLAPERLLGLLIGFGGIVLLVSHKLSLAGDRTAVLAGLLAAACYGFSTHYTRKHLAGIPPLALSAGSLIGASIVLLPFALTSLPKAVPSTTSLLYATVLGIVCTGVAYLLYFRLLRNVGPTRAIMVTYLIPVFGMAWGALFLAEHLSLQMLAGAAVVLTGTMLVVRGSRSAQPKVVTPCPNSPPRPAP
ncbi:MAG: EamA family transporter [Planctomycetes bacterium]|nr:EamA family transporter [Planctomycetota bacterium]